MYDIWFWHYSRCSTLPVEKFLSSDVKHMSLEVPAEADTVDSTLKFINHQCYTRYKTEPGGVRRRSK